MELFKAHKQWATRPDDERFQTLEELHKAVKDYAADAREKEVTFADVRLEAIDDDVQIVGRKDTPAKLTHWAFGQLCKLVSFPASALRGDEENSGLPPTLATQVLNYKLKERLKKEGASKVANLLFHSNGSLLLRAITTDTYSRIWNHEITERLLDLKAQGWEEALPDIRAELDPNGPRAALYASDHDMFAFVRNRNSVVREPGNPDGLQRGVIVENSEVGASALKLTRFLYREMCGNHIIWGASKVIELKVRHVGSARERFGLYAAQIRRYADESTSDIEAKIAEAKSTIIGATKEQVLDALFGIKSLGLTRKALEASYDAVVPDQDGKPESLWGMAQGITRYSQTIPFADKRTELDRAAGKLLDVNF